MNRLVRNVIILCLVTAGVAAASGAEALAPMAAFSKDARILFQGDSITDGQRGRSEDPNHILGHGYCFIIAAKHGAAVVHFQKVFDAACQRAPAEHWIWDGVHPTYSGHHLMADEWLHTVNEFWR